MPVAPVVKLHVETSGAVLSNCPPPLGCAALCGEFVAARYLLNHGADPNKIDGTGFAPLHCAAKNGNQPEEPNQNTKTQRPGTMAAEQKRQPDRSRGRASTRCGH
uniref:Uncharacterized protein n=1 Tax=Triticum urartu TaxID=4572 RepID=A0A8R7U2S1_TRIUA